MFLWRRSNLLLRKIVFLLIIIEVIRIVAFPMADQQSQLNNIQKSLNEYKTEQSQINSQKKEVSSELQDLDKKINDTQKQLNSTELSLYDLNLKLNSIQVELNNAKETENKQKELLKEQVNAIYTCGQVGYLDILFNSKNIDDFLNRLELIKSLLSFDNNLLVDYHKQTLVIKQKENQMFSLQQTIKKQENFLQDRSRDLQYALVSREGIMRSLDKQSQYIQEREKELERESQQIEDIIRSEQEKSLDGKINANSNGKLAWPCIGPITSPFGYRGINPYTGQPNDFHPGIDIGVPDGTPIRAAADGIVSYSGLMEGYGNVVIINNGNGISTLYAHNEKLLVVVGQRVSKGEVIAYSGHIGWATGPHCHFGVYVNGIPVNPLLYLK
ncbi:hypothetical protein BVF91_11215 [Thermoanaerobacterium sp. PSU-2]|nr:hypothetical protein BVF91_11215 [Thermoanaerobacterium sp. PSU-2]